jgi:hypothetical protein
MDALLHLHKTSSHQERRAHWLAALTTSVSAAAIVGLFLLTWCHFRKTLCVASDPNSATRLMTSPTPPCWRMPPSLEITGRIHKCCIRRIQCRRVPRGLLSHDQGRGLELNVDSDASVPVEQPTSANKLWRSQSTRVKGKRLDCLCTCESCSQCYYVIQYQC